MANVAVALRARPWLAAGLVAALLLLGASIAWTLVSRVPAVRFGDFPVFYSAGRLALEGPPAAAYDAKLLADIETRLLGDVPVRQLVGGSRPAQPVTEGSWGFYYPPTYLLLVMAVALLPYPIALLTWIFGAMAAYIAALTRIAGTGQNLMLAVVLPTVFMATAFAQTGFLIGAALAFGLLLLERRPLLAGAVLALLTLKPHLALVVPLVLLAGGHWRALLCMSATALGAALLSWAAVGTECWIAFFNGLLANQQQTANGFYQWTQQSSVFALLRSAGVTPGLAWAAHAAAAILALLIATLAWRRRLQGCREAALCAATVIVPSHVLLYDLTLVPLGLVFLLRAAAPGARGAALAIAIGMVPLLAWTLSAASSLSLSALAPLVLLAWAARHLRGPGS